MALARSLKVDAATGKVQGSRLDGLFAAGEAVAGPSAQVYAALHERVSYRVLGLLRHTLTYRPLKVVDREFIYIYIYNIRPNPPRPQIGLF